MPEVEEKFDILKSARISLLPSQTQEFYISFYAPFLSHHYKTKVYMLPRSFYME